MSWNAFGLYNHQSSTVTTYNSQVEIAFRLDCNWINGSPYFNLWVKRGPTATSSPYSNGSYFGYDEIDTSTVMGSTAGWYIASNWDLPSSIVNSGSGFKINMILQSWSGSNGTVTGIQPVTSFDYSHTNVSYGTDISSSVGTSDPSSIWTGTGTGASAFMTKTVNSANSTFNNGATASTISYPADPGGSGAQTASALSWGVKTTAIRQTGGNTSTFTTSSTMDIIVQIELEDQNTSSSNDLPYHLIRTNNLLQRVTTGGGGGGGGGFTPFTPTFQSFYQEPLQQEINRFTSSRQEISQPLDPSVTNPVFNEGF
jgi:hypothetical protein